MLGRQARQAEAEDVTKKLSWEPGRSGFYYGSNTYIQASFHAALLIWFMLVYVPPLMHLSKAVNYIQKYKRFLKVTESDTEISEINTEVS